ncbi:MAG: TauD/TfdA family dioxygenase [Halioglobus sp.]|nr:TauD/TfdA family dioxygenase [Halioglobus sp.]
MFEVTPSGQACGAEITGVDLSGALDAATISALRAAWLEHHVLVFPDQVLCDADLERFVLSFGAFGAEPYFLPKAGSEHIVALTRRADEKAPLFAENWHSDWSFLEEPPIGTCLYSLVIPPVGGETGFANQQKALAEMPAALRARIEGRTALHSAGAAYAPDGMYGEKDKAAGRSMAIRFSEDARQVQKHPFILKHPESGRETLLSSLGYIMGVEGMDDDAALALLLELYEWQTREEFQYTHKWRENMFVLWDNRSVLHRAYGGYDGYDRELHRITVAADPSKFIAPPAA